MIRILPHSVKKTLTLGNEQFLFDLCRNVSYSYRTEFDPKCPHFNWADTQPVIIGWYGGFDGLCLVNLLCSIALRVLAQTYLVGAHFEAFTKGFLEAPMKTLKNFL